MAWKLRVLVVANVTAESDELLSALRERAERSSARFTLLVPATAQRGGREAAEQRLEAALERMRAAGLTVEGRVGSPDPVTAVYDVWDPGEYDEIVVSTLEGHTSRWLESGVPRRIGKLTDALVTHVTAQEKRAQKVSAPRKRDEDWGVLTPLRGLGRSAPPPSQ